MEQQSQHASTSVTTWFMDHFKPTLEIHCSRKKIPETLLLTDDAPRHPRTVMDTYSEVNVVPVPADAAFIHSPAPRARSHLDFQVLFFKKYIL